MSDRPPENHESDLPPVDSPAVSSDRMVVDPIPTADPKSTSDIPLDWPTTLPPLPPVPSLPSRPFTMPAPAITAPAITAPPIDELDEDAEADQDEDAEPPNRPLDPALAWIVVVAATIIGLSGLLPDVRYTVLWTTLLVVGLLAILFDRLEVEIPTASDMAWGIGYGLLLGVPLVVIALPQLQRISVQMFVGMSNAYIFQALILIMPASDALFFAARCSRHAVCSSQSARPACGRSCCFSRSCRYSNFRW